MDKPRVEIAITAYNRKESLCNLVAALVGYENGHITVFDDHSDLWNPGALKHPKVVDVITAPVHRGKVRFWETYNTIFSYFKDRPADYYIILPDDVEPCPNFVEECTAAYDKAGCICLSPLLTNRSLLPGISRWGRQPIIRKDWGYLTSYFDCCTICRRDFFEAGRDLSANA